MLEVLKIQFNCYPFLSILGGSVSWISSWSKKMNKEPFLEKIVVSLNMQWWCKLCNSLRLLLCLPPMHRKNATPLQLSTIFSLSLDFVDVCARFFYPSQFV